MKRIFGLLLSFVLLVIVAQSRALTLPDACGQDEVKFSVKTQKGVPVSVGTEPDKAQIVFIETVERSGNVTFIGGTTTRFGVDGAWVGASKGNSYFTLTVNPGVHHLCANWQIIGADRRDVAVASFTAESGKVYYYQAKIIQKGDTIARATGPGVTSGGRGVSTDMSFNLTPLSEDEGKYLVKISALSTGTPKK